MEDVDVGRGSYIDIVLSIDPVAMVPFWDVERDRIDLSDGPAWTSACVIWASETGLYRKPMGRGTRASGIPQAAAS